MCWPLSALSGNVDEGGACDEDDDSWCAPCSSPQSATPWHDVGVVVSSLSPPGAKLGGELDITDGQEEAQHFEGEAFVLWKLGEGEDICWLYCDLDSYDSYEEWLQGNEAPTSEALVKALKSYFEES